MISIKQMNYARAVAEHRHFKRAADACHVSQSALSTGINELERQLGVQIFERDNKRVLVTPLGQQILDRVQRILVEVRELESMGQGAALGPWVSRWQ